MMPHTLMHTSTFILRVLDDTDDNSHLGGTCMLNFIDIVPHTLPY